MTIRAYDSYRDGGVDWLGPIPGHWDGKKLKFLISAKSGGTPSKDKLEYWQGDVPWASAKDLKSDAISDTIDHISDAAVADGAAQVLPAGSVLVLVRGMMLARTFPVVRALVPMAINQDLKALTGTGRVTNEFLAWLLRGTAVETLNRLDEAGHGTKALRMEAWLSMPLPVPPISEQDRISAFLVAETDKIDALVEAQRRLIDLLKEKRQAAISHAVTKGLDPSAPMKKSGVEWLGDVPAHWTVKRLKHLGSFNAGAGFPHEEQGIEGEELSFHKVNALAQADDEGYLMPSDNTISGRTAARLRAFVFPPGAIVFAKIGAALLLGRFRRLREPACLDNNMMGFVTHSSSCRDFVLHLMSLVRFDLIANPGTVPSLNEGQIANVTVAVPPMPEQEAIAAYLGGLISRMDELSREAESAVVLLQERRSALISAAVTGKIDVRDVAPAEAEAA